VAEAATHLLTIKEACNRLSVSRPTIYDLISKGEVASLKIGSARRIPASEVEAFICRHLEGGGAA
jgi:excisionase family DNA binding protein